MIWLNKLIKDIDAFYVKATSGQNLFKIADEIKLTPEQKALLEKLKKQKEDVKLEQENQSEKQKILESEGRKALQKLDSWDPTDRLTEPYKNFMDAYVQLFTRINTIKPEVVGTALDIARDQLAMLRGEQDNYHEDLDDLGKSMENIEAIIDLATNVLPSRFATLCKFPYLVDAKTAEDAEKEFSQLKQKESLNEQEQKRLEYLEKLSGKTPMWEEEFSSEEFINAIHALLEDAQASAEASIGIELNNAQEALSALNDGGGSVTHEMGVAFQDGNKGITGNILEQRRAAQANYRDKLKDALIQYRKSEGRDNSHEYFEQAMTSIQRRKEYEQRLKMKRLGDPVLDKKLSEQNRKRQARYVNKMKEYESLIKEYSEAKTPKLKEIVSRKIMGFIQGSLYTRGLTNEQLRKYEAMITEANALETAKEEFDKYKESIKNKVTKEVKTRQVNKELGNYQGLLKTFNIALSDIKNAQKKAIRKKGINQELTYFDVPRTNLKNLEAALLKAENEGLFESELNVLRKAIVNAKQDLDKAMMDFAEQDPSVQKIIEQIQPLLEFEYQVRLLIAEELISDTPLNLNTKQTQELNEKIKTLKHLLLQFETNWNASKKPGSKLAVMVHARKLLDKIEHSANGTTYTPVETSPEESAEPDLTEVLKGASMSIKTRKNILLRLQKEAMEKRIIEAQDLSINDLLSRIGDTSKYQAIAESKTHQTFMDLADKNWGIEDSMLADDENYDDDDDDCGENYYNVDKD